MSGSVDSISGLPPFCRVAGQIAPTRESQILFEVWLPLENWNGKFSGVGNAGWSGTIPFGSPSRGGGLAEQLQRGYATAASNTGHPAGISMDAARFAYEHPERLIDFAFRAQHEMTVAAKAIVQAFYGRVPQYSYWIGISTGGYQGLMEAQRFPDDYDGIMAAEPAINWMRLMAGGLETSLATDKDSTTRFRGSASGVLNRAVLAACDAEDGVADGVLEDPRRCSFDPTRVQCTAGVADDCLTPQQVAAAKRVYAGLKDLRTGTQLFPGLSYGSEGTWGTRTAIYGPVFISHFRWVVFADSLWNWRAFDFADAASYETFRRSETRLGPVLNATSPDLAAFRQRGGKLIQWHGWSDPAIAAQSSVDYYESVLAHFSRPGESRDETLRDVQGFYRLFMVPGMYHGPPGPGGPSRIEFDMQVALEDWVERGRAPGQVFATYPANDVAGRRTRLLCPYPNVALYRSGGNTNEATSFSCGSPRR